MEQNETLGVKMMFEGINGVVQLQRNFQFIINYASWQIQGEKW